MTKQIEFECPTCSHTVAGHEHPSIAERFYEESVENMTKEATLMNYHQLCLPLVPSEKGEQVMVVSNNGRGGKVQRKPLLLMAHGMVKRGYEDASWFYFIPLADVDCGYVAQGLSGHELLEQVTPRLFESSPPLTPQYFWHRQDQDEAEPVYFMVQYDQENTLMFGENALPCQPSELLTPGRFIVLAYYVEKSGYRAAWCRALDEDKKDKIKETLEKYRFGHLLVKKEQEESKQ